MNKKGFTLIEMLIVVAIIGLLASVVVLGIGNARERARDARRSADIRQIQNGAEGFYAANNAYPSALSDISGAPTTDPIGDAYEYEVTATGYRVGICTETNSNVTPTDLCPSTLPSCGTGQICGGSE